MFDNLHRSYVGVRTCVFSYLSQCIVAVMDAGQSDTYKFPTVLVVACERGILFQDITNPFCALLFVLVLLNTKSLAVRAFVCKVFTKCLLTSSKSCKPNFLISYFGSSIVTWNFRTSTEIRRLADAFY